MRPMNQMGMIPAQMAPPPQPTQMQGGMNQFQQSVPTIATLAAQSPLVIGNALSGNQMGYADGGMVMQAAQEMLQDAPPEIMQAVQAFASGQLDAPQLMDILVQAGISPESAQEIVTQLSQAMSMDSTSQMPPPPQSQQVPQNPMMATEAVVNPKPDRERLYNEGGVVSGTVRGMEVGQTADPRLEEMMSGASGSVKSIKKKTKITRGSQSEESEYTIDFDTAMPPMSQMALDAFEEI